MLQSDWSILLHMLSCRSHEKERYSSYEYPPWYEVPMDSNPSYDMPALTSVRNHDHTVRSMFVEEQRGHPSSATNVDSLSDEWEGSADYEYVTNQC